MLYYIAGGMTGHRWFNFPAFDDAARFLWRQGIDFINPAQEDREHGFDAMALPFDYDWNKWPDTLNKKEVIRRDIEGVMRCDKIYLLYGWETSTGARCEKALADWLGKEIIYQEPPVSEISIRVFNINKEKQ